MFRFRSQPILKVIGRAFLADAAGGLQFGLARWGGIGPSECGDFQQGIGLAMGKFHAKFWAIPLVVALAGCTGGGGGFFGARTGNVAGIDAAAQPLDTTVIATQTLGPAPTGSAPATGRVIGAAPAATAAATPTPATTTPTPATTESAADIGAAAAAALRAGSTATTEAATAGAAQPAATPAPSSPEEAACIDQGGAWARAGETGAMSCVFPMKDAGKACSKESDCESQCLARSNSCAPMWPMFGCTDVIQDNGAVVALCLN